MCRHLELAHEDIHPASLAKVLGALRQSHTNGGAFFASHRFGESQTFDWFASRNRLAEFGILTSLVGRKEVRLALPELQIPDEQTSEVCSQECSITKGGGFKMESPFLFDGLLAHTLYAGGAYGVPKEGNVQRLDEKQVKQLALAVCDDLFEQRFSEISLFNNYDPWTAWLGGIAWDWTAVLFDRRKRSLSILAVTDTD